MEYFINNPFLQYVGKLKHSHNTISLCSAMFLDDCNAGRQCRLCFFEIFCIQSTSRPPKILYHKRGALSIRLRFRWRGAVCYTSQDLRSLTTAAHLLAHLRCPKKSAHPLVLDFFRPLRRNNLRFFRPRRRLPLTSALHLFALLRCPKKPAHPLVLDFLDRCAKGYFEWRVRKGAYQGEALYIINTKCCISSATCCGISSSRRGMHASRDEIQGRKAPLMIYTTLRAVMICQAAAWIATKEKSSLSTAFFFGLSFQKRCSRFSSFRDLRYDNKGKQICKAKRVRKARTSRQCVCNCFL